MDIFPLVAASVAGLAVVLISLVGLVTKIPAIKAAIESRLTLLSSFSAGVFLMVGVMLMIEIFEGGISFWPVASVVIGAIGSLALSLIPEYHHHHYEKNTPHKHSKQSAMRILVSDGLHNMGTVYFLLRLSVRARHSGSLLLLAYSFTKYCKKSLSSSFCAKVGTALTEL